MIEVETRLRVGRGLGKTETEASLELLHQLKRRGHPDAPPPLVSDGWGGHREALLEVYGEVPPYSGRGRPPSLKQPGETWQYVQMVKQREKGRVIGVESHVIFGQPEQVLVGLEPHTAYVERTNLTARHMNGRLVRKTLGFSKRVFMLRAASVWEDGVYNLARHVKTLRLEVNDDTRRWLQRSPAMVAGLTDHIWSIEELLSCVPIPNNT
ncbi:MAG: hypothetical protein KatS3mg051_1487 [Anaerolineae bacterium]|nr:MAG: hypothetical protein KatS3mg051_1487 [Anaerolineae bacterium]